MSWWDQVFRYCERGSDPSFWAEPLNAVSNAAFILAAIAAGVSFARKPRLEPAPGVAALIALVFVIGVGSFLFHTYATRWASMADVIPIGIFMLSYLGYALSTYLKLNWLWVAVGLVIFVAALQITGSVDCRPGFFSPASARGACLNGTGGYVPAFLAMMGIGAVLAFKRHEAGGYLLSAGLLFFASMLFRIVDLELCSETRIAGGAVGTHFMWHILNAATLYLLLLAAVHHGQRIRP